MPGRDEVVRLANRYGTLTALVLDANVCLDLAGVTSGRLNPVQHDSADRLLRHIEESGVDVLPGLGLTELSLDRTSWTIDPAKMISIQRSITTAIDSVPGRIEQRTGQEASDDPDAPDPNLFRTLIPLLKLFYASLLKVALISSTGCGRDDALRNLRQFLSWMAEDLDCMSALALQAAIAIFGGDTLARKLIGFGKPHPLLRDVWSGAWDVFYAQQIFQLSLSTFDGTPCYPVFVTRDRACFAVFSKPALRGAVRLDEGRAPFLVDITSEYPHFSGRQDEVLEILRTVVLSRVDRWIEAKRGTEAHLDAAIAKLETDAIFD